jgi:hypothetical protein
MKSLASLLAIAALSFIVTNPTQAFQVFTQDQLANGIGVRGGMGFTDLMPEEESNFQVEFSAADRVGMNRTSLFGGYSDQNNWWGRRDGGGRNYGDRKTNWQSCGSTDSQVGMLNAFGSGSGGSYPCQRFR